MTIRRLSHNSLSIGYPRVELLVSYRTVVAFAHSTGVYVTTKKWSRTTSKHITQWLFKLGVNKDNVKPIDQAKLDTIELELRVI